jgi:glycosyltransferase involved in cell wall biosynthesis
VIPSFLIHESFEAPDLNFLSRLPADPYILFVGELQPHKGLKTLLDAYQQLADPPPLVLIGYVTPGVPQQFPPGVVVLQDVPHVDVMAAWERCLLGVAPSLWPEPLGGVVYEGMSAGKAVIGTVPGGHVDIIEDGISGLLICSGDANALAKAMQRLIENPGFREQMGRAALKRSEIFTAEVSVPRFEQLYQRLVDRSAG